ncbi:MAG: UDP-2,3-diacylglucosamine diphosphatase [Acidobacteriota bacterium]
MSVAVIADSHLGGPGGAGDDFIAQLRALPARGCSRLILLGDIFHVWVGSRKFETPEIRRVVPEIRRLRSEGVAVEYVEGNRDFFLTGSPYADAFDRICLETSFESGGRRYLCVHGDGLNDKDRQYLFWRWLSKSPPVRALVLGLPGSLAQRAVGSAEKKLAGTNFKHRTHIPKAPISAYAERRFQEGFDALLLGHFHEPHDWPVEGGDVHLLDAWFRSRRVEVFR